MLKHCPVCGARGVDLAFAFECTNPGCQNYASTGPALGRFEPEDLRLLLGSLWAMYRETESLDEFIEAFFASGGRIEPSPDSTDIAHAMIYEPEWLRQRMVA